MPETTLTWLGHAAFRVDTADGKRIYVDPFLNGNPKCPESEQTPERVDVIAITHGHGDHVGDTVALAKQHDCKVVALVELSGWLGKQGVDEAKLQAPNKGGTVDVDGVKFTLTNAFHSGSAPDGSYAGEPSGILRPRSLCSKAASRIGAAVLTSRLTLTIRLAVLMRILSSLLCSALVSVGRGSSPICCRRKYAC